MAALFYLLIKVTIFSFRRKHAVRFDKMLISDVNEEKAINLIGVK